MDRLVIHGGQRLRGVIEVSGAKNAALPCLAASLLTDQPCTLRRVPEVRDVTTMSRLLATLGVSVTSGESAETRHLTVTDASDSTAGYHLVRQMRASVCVLGPLVAKRRRARVAMPGGCQIGHRPIDIHLRGLAALGTDVRTERGDVVVEAATLRGAEIDLSGPAGPTVTGTCNVLAAATLASGTTVLRNTASEPEVADFIQLLTSMGAAIERDDQSSTTLIIHGVSELGGFDHQIIGDRIEAGTWAAVAAATFGDLTITGCKASHWNTILEWCESVGVTVTRSNEQVTITANAPPNARDVTAAPFPGVPTDVQAQLAAVLTQSEGEARVTDHVFPERFGYLAELSRLGADVTRTPGGAAIRGVTPLVGTDVLASDLRASAALVVAGLAASDQTIVRRIYHLDRGYERLVEKLTSVGATIRRESDEYAF